MRRYSLYLVLVGELFVFLAAIGVWVALLFDEHELPKIVGAAFGAFFSGSIAILVFFLTRTRDQEKSEEELTKLRKAYWLDTWATLPVVYEEWMYWRSRKRGSTSYGQIPHPKSTEVIIEHLRSVFFEANLTLITRLPTNAQTNLLVFQDDLRIVRERLVQVAPLVTAYEKVVAEFRGKSIDFDQDSVRDALIDIGELTNDLEDLLSTVLLYGWAAQMALDTGPGDWRAEYMKSDDGYVPRPLPGWIGGIISLREERRRTGPHTLPDDLQ